MNTLTTAVTDAQLSIWKGLVKPGKVRTGWLHNAVHKEYISDIKVSVQCQVASLQGKV